MSVADTIEKRPSAPARLRASLGQRGIAFFLALAVELLVALLLWFIAPTLPDKRRPPTTVTFGIDTAPGETEAPARTERKIAATRSAAREQTRRERPRPVETPPPEPERTPLPQTFIRMTRSEYRAADIATKGSTPRLPAEAEPAVAASGSRPGDSAIVGTAPNGEPMYDAEWYRKPTYTLFAPYLPHGWAKNGTGRVTCRMGARYHMEDCRILGESPSGSGYGYATLQAAWQFRMIPPRRGGKEVTNAWIRIEVTYSMIEK